MCPFSLKKKKKGEEVQFSDHNAIMVKLQMTYEKKKQTRQSKSWRITNDGLQKLAMLTEEKFDMEREFEASDIQELYDFFEQDMMKIMDDCFRVRKNSIKQKTPNTFIPPAYHIVTKFGKKGKVQRRVARQYIETILEQNKQIVAERQKEKIQNTLENLTVNNTFSPNSFWNLCKKAKKKGETGTSVETDEGIELYGEEMIQNAYENEFKHRLRKREIDGDLKNYEARTEKLCELYLEDDKLEKNPPYTQDELDKVRSHLKKGKSPGRDNLPAEVYIVGGNKLQKSTLKLLNKIKEENGMPQQWTQVQISTMYKNKGKRKKLVNQRGIFLKQVLSKIYGKLNMNRAADAMESINKCQAGGMRNRSTADPTYLLRAASDHCIIIII